ncbi:MAG: recombinase family protein [Rubrobacter sp.]|nr:recombinase family protein [Rubrobacter sp.]
MPSINEHYPKRVILYARVASEAQAENPDALEQHFAPLRTFARRKGYEVIAEIADVGWSGHSTDRPGINRAFGTAAQEDVFALLAGNRDRFSRDLGDLLYLDKEFGEHGCKLFGVAEMEAGDA